MTDARYSFDEVSKCLHQYGLKHDAVEIKSNFDDLSDEGDAVTSYDGIAYYFTCNNKKYVVVVDDVLTDEIYLRRAVEDWLGVEGIKKVKLLDAFIDDSKYITASQFSNPTRLYGIPS